MVEPVGKCSKAESAAATIFYFLQMSLDKLKTDPNHKEQFIQDYLAASEYADAAIAAETNEAKKKTCKVSKIIWLLCL